MKKSLTTLFILLTLAFTAQVFNGAGGAIINNGGQETFFNASVSGLPGAIDKNFGLVQVTLNVSHIAVEELSINLVSPWGAEVSLTGVLSLKGSNFTNTIFDSGNPLSITQSTAPYTGTFRPVGYFGRFNTGKNPNGTWKLVVKDFVLANAGTVDSWSIKFASNAPEPVVLQSSNLPIVTLNTNGQKLGDVELIANLGIIDNGGNRNNVTDPKNNYNGKASVHIRGSSSKMFEKNNIKVELRDNSGAFDIDVPLLGMPPESDWVLTAFYNDKSLMRNPLTHHLFSSMGKYAPRFRYVELVLNDEYYGIYMLMEQPKRGSDRVDIAKMTNLDNDFPHITGGYIIQINRTDDPGWYSLYPGISSTGAKFYYQYNYPKPEEITEPQKAYIKAVMDSFETVMASPNFADPKTGYKKFINDDSFIDFMIINELSKNVDAYKLSTYLFKDNVIFGGKLNIGPTWDYDLAWHNVNYGNAFNELYFQWEQPNNEYPIPTWWTTFIKDKPFKDKLYCRYHTLRQYTLSDDEIYQFIDETTNLLQEAQQRNFKQFPIIGAYIYGNPQDAQSQMTWAKEIEDLKKWVNARGTWLDANMPGFCADVAIDENVGDGVKFKSFPGPFNDRLNIEYDMPDGSGEINISLYDITGARVIRAPENNKTGGKHLTSLDCSSLPPGVYILQLNAGTSRYHQKVIKGMSN
jgi:subtilisin-like proprotein convertase family protein